jgi:hypothetical protein
MSLAPLDLENTSGALNQPKIIYAGDAYQGQPYIVVTEDNIILVGDSNNVINVGPDFGVLLSGKLSLSAMPDQIAIGGGYWRLNPLLTSCVPSTTPMSIVSTRCLASRHIKHLAHARPAGLALVDGSDLRYCPADPPSISAPWRQVFIGLDPNMSHFAASPPEPGCRTFSPDLGGQMSHFQDQVPRLPAT